MDDFDWNDLRSFLAVARTGTLTAAAKDLRMDHTTIGRRIRILENSLKAKLFDRRNTGYRLTRAGHGLAKAAEAMDEIAFSAKMQIEQSDLSLSGMIRIGATDGFGTYFLAPRLAEFRRSHDSLEVQLVAVPRISNLSKREADLAIALTRPREGRLYSRKLTDYELGVYGAAEYLDSFPQIRSRDDLIDHQFISYIEDLLYAKELNYIPRVNPRISPKLKISNPIGQVKATIAGGGLSILPCFMADSESKLVRVLPDEIALSNSFWLVTHADQRELARVKAAADYITNAVKAERRLFLPGSGRAGR